MPDSGNEPDREGYAYESASVLFSGGTDSALAAVRMLETCRRVTLLTFDPGYIFFVDNSRIHADALRERFGDDRVEHVIRPIGEIVREVLFPDVKGDLRRYGFDMTALVCMGCRLSMHTAAIIHNLEHGIPVFCTCAPGSRRSGRRRSISASTSSSSRSAHDRRRTQPVPGGSPSRPSSGRARGRWSQWRRWPGCASAQDWRHRRSTSSAPARRLSRHTPPPANRSSWVVGSRAASRPRAA